MSGLSAHTSKKFYAQLLKLELCEIFKNASQIPVLYR
jgi:hypothetical protein